jgi:hypothetical protein
MNRRDFLLRLLTGAAVVTVLPNAEQPLRLAPPRRRKPSLSIGPTIAFGPAPFVVRDVAEFHDAFGAGHPLELVVAAHLARQPKGRA